MFVDFSEIVNGTTTKVRITPDGACFLLDLIAVISEKSTSYAYKMSVNLLPTFFDVEKIEHRGYSSRDGVKSKGCPVKLLKHSDAIEFIASMPNIDEDIRAKAIEKLKQHMPDAGTVPPQPEEAQPIDAPQGQPMLNVVPKISNEMLEQTKAYSEILLATVLAQKELDLTKIEAHYMIESNNRKRKLEEDKERNVFEREKAEFELTLFTRKADAEREQKLKDSKAENEISREKVSTAKADLEAARLREDIKKIGETTSITQLMTLKDMVRKLDTNLPYDQLNKVLKAVGMKMSKFAHAEKIPEDNYAVNQYDPMHYETFKSLFTQESNRQAPSGYGGMDKFVMRNVT
jgi:hypothetical protein